MKTKNIVSRNIPFTVRLVENGDKYGLNDCLTHEKSEPLVEFYDGRYMHTDYGQFINCYSATTIQSCTNGINLDGGVPDWKIDTAALQEVIAWITECKTAPNRILKFK